MADITILDDHRPEPEIWRCHCDCISFQLYADGTVECASCGEFQTSLEGDYIPNRLLRDAELVDGAVPPLNKLKE